jgi:ABC-type branched-subunit amino acid transport system substrate-binding protein
MNRPGVTGIAALVAALVVGAGVPVHAAALTPLEESGRAIFENGASPVGDVFSARLGMGEQELPGVAVRCANCHGSDGLGRPEGGVRPANITWSELTKAYGHIHDNGRRHPAFDDASLKRALTEGIDPAGNPLDGAMPRFNISRRDFESLLAYLKKLETLRDPGVGADTLRIGTLLPSTGRFAELGEAIKGILRAYLDNVNLNGGVFGRKLELVVADYGDDPDSARRALRQLVLEGKVFALLAPFVPGVEEDLGRLANDAKIPVVGPLSLFGDDPHTVNQYVFHLLSGVGELAEALAVHVASATKLKAEPAVLRHTDSASGVAVADAVEERLKSQGWTRLSRVGFQPELFDARAMAKMLEARGARSVFLLGPGLDVSMLARQAVESGYVPELLLPGPLVPRSVLDLPPAFEGRILLAYPTLPTEQKPDALREFARLYQKRALSRGHQTSQVPAYSSAVLLVQVLEQIGRDLTRDKFVAAMESIHGFESGLLPTLSFNSRRRVGASGGYIVAVDLEARRFRPVGEFVQLP